MDTDLDPAVVPIRSFRSGRRHVLLFRSAIGLGIGAALVLTFLRLVNLGAVDRRLLHLDIGPALACGAVFLMAYAVRALRWRWFLSPDKVGVGRAIAIYLIAIFINWLLPVRGGELAKSLILRRSNAIPVSRSLATVTMDKAMDLMPAVILFALVPFVHLHLSRSLWLLLLSMLTILGLGVLLLGLAAWKRDRALSWLLRIASGALPQRLSNVISPFLVNFVDTLVGLVKRPRVLLIAAVYTTIAVGLDALFCFLAFRAVGVSVSIPVVLYGYTFYNLAYILPTPPGQIGSNELIGLLIFSGVFGVSRSGVGAMFLFSHPWTALLMSVSGIICLSRMGLTLRSTLRLADAARPMESE